MQPPHGQQIGHRPSADPDRIGLEQDDAGVAVGHRKELEVAELNVPASERGVGPGQVAAIVAAGRHDKGQARTLLASEFEHATDRLGRLGHAVAVPTCEAARGRHDATGGHGCTP